MEGVQKIALFIDADNVSSRFGKLLIDNLEKRGEVTVRRIYGNWEKTALRKWDDCILKYGLRTVHQIDFSTGKNATDMTLTIDAMDVLYKNQAKIFAIVSNDSDFTPLAVRLREYGIYVIGIGMKDTSTSFKSACSEYISLESLGENEVENNLSSTESSVENKTSSIKEEKFFESALKILELEQKIAELERKISSPQWSIGFRLTAEENKNSAMPKSSTKIKQKIICNTLTPDIAESSESVEVATSIEPAPIEIQKPVEVQKTAEVSKPVEVQKPKHNLVFEVVPIVQEPARNVEKFPAIETPTDIKGVVSFKPSKPVELEIKQPEQVAKKKGTVELQKDNSPPIETPDKVAAMVDDKAAERAKALNLRLSQCGQKGMRNPKRKMQQIHDSLQETAKLHGDKNGFVPLTFAGQDLKKKNLGFGIKDFGYMLLNEFISDFPELYELSHTKPRSFRYRCLLG